MTFVNNSFGNKQVEALDGMQMQCMEHSIGIKRGDESSGVQSEHIQMKLLSQ